MRLFLGKILCVLYLWGISDVEGIPEELLYEFNVPEAVYLPRGDDVSSNEIKLKEPIVFFGNTYDSIFVNTNGLLSFQTEIPQFINIEFPLDYPIIAPFYSNVDTRRAGKISYYETEHPGLIQRATENVHESFLNFVDYQATSLFIVTWQGVGYYNSGADKLNTYQVVISTDGEQSYVEFLYPENGIQWIRGTGDNTGLPNARAQAGIISPEGRVYSLPGSGTEQVKNLNQWSNIGLDGQFIYRIDQLELVEPDAGFSSKPKEPSNSCAGAKSFCHLHARCKDYDEGFCCECNQDYYGNGKHCVKKDLPLRVNGRVTGKINGETLEVLNLQSYVEMSLGRAYTAISKIPESIGFDIQSLQILGGVIGYVFAKPIRNALNGYQITGGVFNHSATINFHNTSQSIRINQKFLGLDVFDRLRLESDLQGEIPTLPFNCTVTLDEYQEEYTRTGPGIIQMTSQRTLRAVSSSGEEKIYSYTVNQNFVFDYCKYDNITVGETWKLKVGKNFIRYENIEQIIRFGLSNKITPLGDFDPCEEGRSQCGENSGCVVDNDSFKCVCNPGYQALFDGTNSVCADIDECQTGQHECDYNAQCINQIGSYSCECNPGYEGDGHICDNARSCQNVSCTENAECVESNGVASCRCLAGFRGDGQYCTPIPDHSCHIANNCSPYGYCSINPQTNNYYCACLPGYTGDGYNCIEVETTTPLPVTTDTTTSEEILQQCTNEGCYCPKSYIKLGGTPYCVPEPVTVPVQPIPRTTTTTERTEQESCYVLNNCHPNASCLYSDYIHDYECVCNDGLEGNGYNCEAEVFSCSQVDNCHSQASCLYDEILGKSNCVCNPGFQGDGYSCVIASSCSSNSDCTPTEDCISTSPQKYECICKEGYIRDSQNQCVIISDCGGATCVDNAECLYDNEVETYYCQCKIGFVGDGISECREKVVGCDTLNNCGAYAHCKFIEEEIRYKCICNDGFFGNGFECYAERNCHTDPTMCSQQASCLTDSNRNFWCKCNPGFIGNGSVCKEISQHEGNYLLLNQGMSTLKLPLDPRTPQPRKPIQAKAFQTAVGLDVDCLEGRVYWSDISGRAIRSAKLDGSDKNDFISLGIGSPEGISIDWVSRNIYWTDSTLDTIEVANLESRLRRTLFNTDLVNPRGIAVHPQRGKIFWTDWDRKNPKIEWANADGSDRKIFLARPDVSLPNSLTIDFETEHLCYTDAGTKEIACVQIDNKYKQVLAVNLTYPFGITTTHKDVFWTDWVTKKVEGVEKQTLKRLAPVPIPLGGTGNRLFALTAVSSSCPSLSNVCENYKNQCSKDHICVPDGLGGKQCICGYHSDDPEGKTSCNL